MRWPAVVQADVAVAAIIGAGIVHLRAGMQLPVRHWIEALADRLSDGGSGRARVRELPPAE